MNDDVSYYTELTMSHVEDKTEWKQKWKKENSNLKEIIVLI